jgi:hypothetical protein
VPSCSIGAGLVEKPLADIFPDGTPSVEPDRVCLLNFNDPRTALTLDAEHVLVDVGEGALLDRGCGLASRARISEHGTPHLHYGDSADLPYAISPI